jgi:predicted HD phosphohydrolase
MTTPLADVDALLDLLAGCDGVYDAPPPEGDPVDLLQHGLQCAYLLAQRRPDDVGLQLAGLVHDIGHAIPGGHRNHAMVAAEAVRPVLGGRVAALVELHVPAKRYLATMEPSYDLSEASATSLVHQGGMMSAAEVAAFERSPHAADAVVLRRADEDAKVVDLVVPGLDTWVMRLREHAAAIQPGALG